MINTMYQEKSGQYVKKHADLTISASIEEKCKKIGFIKLDLSELILGVSQKWFSISDCPDKKASICMSVKFTSMGEAGIDNTSEASGHSGISFGTEGDYSGSLANENESLETDEEGKKRPKSKKPPLKKRPESENSTNTENLAFLKVLQKENSQLKAEKEEIKTQFMLFTEKSKKERDQYCEYAEKIEKEMDEIKLENKKLRTKCEENEENLDVWVKKFEEVADDLEKQKNRYNHAEKRKLKDQIKTLKKNDYEREEQLIKSSKTIEELLIEKQILSQKWENLCTVNENLAKTNEKLLFDLEEAKKGPETKDLSQTLPEGKTKKAQQQISQLKKELQQAHEEIEDLRTKTTESILKISQLKINHGKAENILKEKIRELEFLLSDKNEEYNELSQRLEEEIQTTGLLQRKTITDKEETDDKVAKLTQSLKEVEGQKESLEESFIKNQRLNDKNKADPSSFAKLEGTIAVNQKEIAKLQSVIKEKDKKIEELTSLYSKTRSEYDSLQDHFSAAKNSEFSDPAVSILTEKNLFLEKKIQENEELFGEEKRKMEDYANVLEKESEILENKYKSQIKQNENKIDELMGEVFSLKEKLEKTEEIHEPKPRNTIEFVTVMQNESNKQSLEMLKIQLSEAENNLNKTIEELRTSEQKNQEFKLVIAKKDLEKDILHNKYKDAQNQLRDFSNEFTQLEVELFKVNERFGQALNSNNELENELQDIKEQIFKAIENRNKR